MEVILFLNSACNAGCKHCYIECSGERSPEDALETVKALHKRGHDVGLAGSEVLLNPKYLEAYKQAGQCHILTNGIVLDRDKSLYPLLQQNGIAGLVFSMHWGARQKIKSVPESLVARVIKESKSRGFIVKIFTLITSENYDSVAQICEKAVGLGVDILQPLRFVAAGRGKKLKQLSLTPEQLAAFFLQIENARKIYPRSYPRSILEISIHGNFGPRPGSCGEQLAKENKYCPAGKERVVIDPQNNVYGCLFLMQPKNKIGIYKDGEIIIEKDLFGGRRDTCIAHLIA